MKRDDVHHQIQANGVQQCRDLHPICWELLKAVPNGGARSKAEAGRLKAEGVVAGAWDLELAVSFVIETTSGEWEIMDHSLFSPTKTKRLCPGLILEVKRPDQRKSRNGGLSDAQVAYGEAMAGVGWARAVVYSTDELYAAVRGHLEKAGYTK